MKYFSESAIFSIKKGKVAIMALNEVLKMYMDRMGIRNKELSERSGIPLRTVNNILGGTTSNPTVETVKAMAHALNCTLDDVAEDMAYKEEVHTIAAHHDGEDWTPEELAEIEAFKKYVLSKRNK